MTEVLGQYLLLKTVNVSDDEVSSITIPANHVSIVVVLHRTQGTSKIS